MNKFCCKCSNEKDISEFAKRKNYDNVYNSWCKECRKNYQKIYKEKNRKKIKENRVKYYKENKEKIKEYYKEYYNNDIMFDYLTGGLHGFCRKPGQPVKNFIETTRNLSNVNEWITAVFIDKKNKWYTLDRFNDQGNKAKQKHMEWITKFRENNNLFQEVSI